MSIIYTLIGKGTDTILVDYTNSFGNFAQITKNILKNIKQESSHSYKYSDKHYFHYTNENGITVMCMTEQPFQQKIAHTFLEDIKQLFHKKFSQNQINLAINYSLNSAFSNNIKDKMDEYNNCQQTGNLSELQQTLIEAKSMMIENIEKIIDREEKIELLVKKTTTMSYQAFDIKKQAEEHKDNVSVFRKMRTKIALGVVAATTFCAYIVFV